MLTENFSAKPHILKASAQRTIDTAKVALPSSVFDVVGDQRCFPNRLPTIEAYECNYSNFISNTAPSLRRTRASPTPSVNTPVNCSSCVCLP
jgi:hypothetical protein